MPLPPLKTCIRGWALSLVALVLAGCSGPAIDVDLDSAKDTFKQRQLSNAKDKKGGKDKAGVATPNAQLPRPQQPLTEGEQRQLIQFRYGEKSLQDPVFATYLRNHSERFSRPERVVQQVLERRPGDQTALEETAEWSLQERAARRKLLVLQEMGKLRDSLHGVNKAVGWTTEERSTRRRLIVLDEMRGMHKALGVNTTSNQSDKERLSGRRLLVLTQMREMRELLKGYGTPIRSATDQLPESEINYRGAPVLTVFSSLASQAAVPIRYSDGLRKSRLRVSGTFTGDPVEIMSQISRLNRLALRTESAGGMFHLFLDIELEANPKLAEGLHDPFSSAALSNADYQVINQYRYIVGLLESGDDSQFRRQTDALNPPQAGLSATQAYEKLSQAANKLKNALREYDAGESASGVDPNKPFRSATLSDAEFHVINQYRKIVSSLENGDDLRFFREVSSLTPPQAGPSATKAFELLSQSSIRLQRLLRQFDTGELGDEDHPALANLGGKSLLASASIPKTDALPLAPPPAGSVGSKASDPPKATALPGAPSSGSPGSNPISPTQPPTGTQSTVTSGLAGPAANPFSSSVLSDAEYEVLQHYRKLVLLLEEGDELRFSKQIEALRPPQAGPLATRAYETLIKGSLAMNLQLRKFDAGELGEAELMALAMPVKKKKVEERPKNITSDILALGKYEAKLCPGEEEATEKVRVTSELPASIKKFLDGYFTTTTSGPTSPNNPAGGQQKPGSPAAPAGAQVPGATPPTGVSSAAGSVPNQSGSSTAIVPGQTPSVPGQQANIAPNTAASPGGQPPSIGATGIADCAQSAAKKQPLKIIEDPTGILLTGSVYDLDLAFRLIRERDIPTLQVLAEVFIVEVNEDWQRKIEGSLTGARKLGTAYQAVERVFNLVAQPSGYRADTTLKVDGENSIRAFIDFIESNSAGRTISSPTIVARDGETAQLDKTLTLRKEVSKVVTTTGPGGQPQSATGQDVVPLELPLKLSIKPQVNRHNRHIVLTFEYDETLPQGDTTINPIAITTTQNKIKTNVETAPGDVVILAGLFKESNSRANKAPPGLSGLGILAPLLGGSHSRARISSELIVFIKPTVIEPRAFTDQVNTVR